MKEYDQYDEMEKDVQEQSSYNLMPFIRKALKGWKTVLLWAVAGGLFGVMISLSTPKTYTSKAVVAPEIITRGTSGGLSTLASMAGINVNTMALTDAMHPDMYPAIIHSSNFYLGLFDMPVTVQTKDSLVHTDLYDYMVNYVKHPWWGKVLGLPFMASDAIKSWFAKGAEEEAEGHASVDSLRLTRQQEGVIKALSKSVIAAVEKRTYLITLSVTTQDPVISADLANAVVDKLQDFVVAYRTEKARENVEYFQKICEETKRDYLAAQRAYTYYLDTHQGLAGKSSMVYQQQLQNEAQLRYQMYSQTAQNLLNAEAKVQQESPVLVVIQPGIAPRMGQPSRIKITILWGLIGAILGIVWVSFLSERIRKKEKVSEEGESES